ncbi:hypothetical protein [Emticicia sp. C21]|uniref:hypothetical protein n=1 Tax=Emticicia sp. C21 TaxID=2302915 RepID=UPI000E351A47|nr:hypothetical protein [Emticicia sp. C21]RFS18595.1 hypothetical protein D0T08_04910 [Emticicia sp. C21]
MAIKYPYLKLFSAIFILLSHTLFGQLYSGRIPDFQDDCLLRINPDSTIDFVYSREDIGTYADHYGKIQKLNDTLFHISATMTIGQFSNKTRRDSIFVSLDSNVINKLGKIKIAYSNGSFKEYNFEEYNNYKRNVVGDRYIKIKINKNLLNSSPGKNFITIAIERKNPITQKPLVFKIPLGSAPAFSGGENLEFDVVIKNGYLWTTGEPPANTGDFKLKKVNN